MMFNPTHIIFISNRKSETWVSNMYSYNKSGSGLSHYLLQYWLITCRVVILYQSGRGCHVSHIEVLIWFILKLYQIIHVRDLNIRLQLLDIEGANNFQYVAWCNCTCFVSLWAPPHTHIYKYIITDLHIVLGIQYIIRSSNYTLQSISHTRAKH